MSMAISAEVQSVYEQAKAVRLKAHAPYSKFLVGVAIKSKSGQVYTGCNVENASYGGTVCGERVAVFNWVSKRANTSEQLDFLVLVTDTENPVAVPCAFCLQVLSEFCTPDFPIYVGNLKGVDSCFKFKELLPSPFDRASLRP